MPEMPEDDAHELLTVQGIPAYLRSRPALAGVLDAGGDLVIREVGDGNLNHVYVITDALGRGLVLKQSLTHVRVDPSWPVPPDRAAREAHALAVQGSIAPGRVPALLDFDDDRYVLALEDLSDHQVWRAALNAGDRHDAVAEELGRFIADLVFATSALGLDQQELKWAIAAAVNPALSKITEDLVFTEPFVEHPRNGVPPANAGDARELLHDRSVLQAAGWAKWAFMTRLECFVHGDLHTGSVMVRTAADGAVTGVRAFDAEFGCYGPAGFDLGMAWGNLVINAARAVVLGDQVHAAWCLEQPGHLWESFASHLSSLWPERRDPRVWPDEMLGDLLQQWRLDATVFAGAEVIRRLHGFAKVADITGLPEAAQVSAIRSGLRAGRALMAQAPRLASMQEAAAVTEQALQLTMSAR